MFRPFKTYVYLVLGLTFLILLSAHNLVNSRVGRALEALNMSEIGALAAGVNINRLKVQLFVVTAIWCGIAGSLFCHYMRFVGPDFFTSHVALLAFAACAIGGLGTIWGALIGGVTITLLPHALEGYRAWQPVIWSFLVIAIMIFLPRGLFPGIVEFVVNRRNPFVLPEVAKDWLRTSRFRHDANRYHKT